MVNGGRQPPAPCGRSHTSLDPHETNGQAGEISSAVLRDMHPSGLPQPLPDVLDPVQVFRHSGWALRRRKLLNAMYRAHLPYKRLERFARCGANAFIVRDPDDPAAVAVISNTCNDRFCVPCGRERARKISSAVVSRAHAEHLRFITLTLKPSCVGLGVRVDTLWAAFAKLRREVPWRQRVDGGVAFLEAKYSERSESWHVHLHVLVQGRYFPQGLLQELWRKHADGSFIVDIRKVRDDAMAAKYVTKYATKPLDPSFEHDPALLNEALGALTSRRLVVQFGNWRGTPLVKRDQARGWKIICSLRDALTRAAAGDQEALSLLELLHAQNLPSALSSVCPDPPARSPPTQPDRPPSTPLFAIW